MILSKSSSIQFFLDLPSIFYPPSTGKDATGVLAFVYFAGHGFLDPQDSAEYLMPVDAANLTPNSNINRESFCLSLRSTPQCAKLLRITDCCRTVYVCRRSGYTLCRYSVLTEGRGQYIS